MQFNDNERKNNTNFQLIEEKYKAYMYTRPNIVFWNVNGSSDDFPVSIDDNGTCLVSGASPAILKGILKSKELSSVSVLREILDDKRYIGIKECLSG